jgi:hypothetical protein
MTEPDEVSAHQYRLAQAHRLQRFAVEQGLDPKEVLAGRADLEAICDANGKVVPEPEDLRAVR